MSLSIIGIIVALICLMILVYKKSKYHSRIHHLLFNHRFF